MNIITFKYEANRNNNYEYCIVSVLSSSALLFPKCVLMELEIRTYLGIS